MTQHEASLPLLDNSADIAIDVILQTAAQPASAQRDQTINVIEKIIDQPPPASARLFRMLSWEQIGAEP